MADPLDGFEHLTVPDPQGRSDDPYADFREVVRVDQTLAVTTRHSLGKTSRFFVGLAEQRLLASRCPSCHRVWLPPRVHCPHDLAVTTWTELSGRGTLVSWTAPSGAPTDPPFWLAYLALDGADTLFLHRLVAPEGALRYGLPVRVAFGEGPVEHPLELCWFEPD
jgi:uncharacterized OB-fold protein